MVIFTAVNFLYLLKVNFFKNKTYSTDKLLFTGKHFRLKLKPDNRFLLEIDSANHYQIAASVKKGDF